MNKIAAFIGCLLFVAGIDRLDAAEPQVISLWNNGAPGFENRRNEPEQAQSYWVRHVNNPSLTVFFPPREKANGAAVVICPGGGHRELVYNHEGVEPAHYFNNLGVAAFVLKYRLAREEGSPYSLENAHQDGQRAMRLVRSRATEWKLDAHRIGIVGFSAGGEVVAMVAYGATDGIPTAADPIDQASCRADFLISVYPGPLGIPEKLPADAPMALLVVADDDDSHVGPVVKLLEKYREVKRPVAVHIFSHGGHGFNMGTGSKLASIKDWPQQMTDWMTDNDILSAKSGTESGK
ncbi:MAG TPA: alpha/beta hydrolase [Verrucomicrobiae bacterium]|jgi:acetyl esterase/lipase|nr:alpha/beta hydrolase [Verrucomicrobiae bacterium]